MKLSEIAEYVTDRISSDAISLEEYVTTDSLLQNKRGRETAQNLPPVTCTLVKYQRGDVLVANIRPYLKKIWFADIDGGCSSDVLVFRAKECHLPKFLYAVLMQDSFYDYAMLGAKGSKMPRGDKEQIMRYELPTFSPEEEENIGNMVFDIVSKIALNRQINDNLEAMAKQLYDYWFVQFDFPNEEGKPYKSSGGAMVWNEKLKRGIPVGWSASNICKIANILSGGTPSKAVDEYWKNGDIPFFGPTDCDSSMFQLETVDHITEEGLKHCASSLFEEGKIPFLLSGPWSVPGLKTANINFGAMLIPTINGNQATTFAGAQMLAVYKYSKNIEAAVKFVEFMATKEAGEILYRTSGDCPALKEDIINEIPGIKDDESIQVMLEQLSSSVPMPTIPQVTYYWAPAETMMKNLWNKEGNIDEEVAKAEKSYKASRDLAS